MFRCFAVILAEARTGTGAGVFRGRNELDGARTGGKSKEKIFLEPVRETRKTCDAAPSSLSKPCFSSTDTMIEIERLTKRFGPVIAVNDLSLRVAKGEVLGFLGPNGAGKSTTM